MCFELAIICSIYILTEWEYLMIQHDSFVLSLRVLLIVSAGGKYKHLMYT